MAKKLRVVIGLVLVLIVLGVSPGGASTAGYENLPGWHWVAGGTLRGVSFATGTSGRAVGDGGLIIRSMDGGVTWRPLVGGTKLNLRHVQFLDNDHGWAVGDDGLIIATDDGGSTWNVQTTPTGADLHRVHFVDAARGWVVGQGGTVLATQNGGVQWTSQASNTTEDLYGVDFVDETHGWAVGGNGTVIATTDGGTTWNKQSCGEIHALYDVDFVDRNNGWIVGWGSALWTTSNGGANWGEWILSAWTRDLYTLELTDAQHGWAVGAGGFIAHYENGSWTEQASGVDVNLYDLDFVDGQRGWAVGAAGTVLSTTDGGVTWHRRSGSTTGAVNALYFIDENHGWAAVGWSRSGFPGELLYTSDGGATWSVQKSGVPYLNDVQFVTPYHGWAVGGLYGDGTILSTTDGGTHWITQTLPVAGPVRGIHFIDSEKGWAVGGAESGNGWILGTTNGGNNWTSQKYIDGSGCLYDVCFSDSTHGWAVGVDGNIWATLNGTNWFTQTSGTTETLTSVYCYGQLGWAVGDSTILATRDGGNTWFVQDSGYPHATFADVDFNGPGWGWVVGMDTVSYESLILVTGDQGITWLPEELPLDAALLQSVHAFRGGRGPVIWAGSSHGMVLSNRPDSTAPVAGTVTLAEGGAIFSSDGSTSLIFPAGVVTATVVITHTPRTASQVPATGDLTGYRMFALTAVYSDTAMPASIVPGAHYTITVDYSGAIVVEDAWLGLYHWDGNAWVKESTSSADWDKNIVTANPDHFSYFAVLGKSYWVYLPTVLKNYP
ncbi:MAG TPA: YCF48-related protein [Anaerolineae bacterium]|nr:YCF48-related protein [Anaerolineae bacterium]HQH38120.1 YCF48-related protein [Anaerolineae bacterium]